MRINVGTTNNAKIEAVRETILDYEGFQNAIITPLKVESQVKDQPLTLEETIQGARNRAKNAFKDCKYSIGLEAGLIPVPHTLSGYMNFNVCVIYDGETFFTGLSSGFEYPPHVIKDIIEGGLEIKDAMVRAGITQSNEVAKGQGNIGILTKGRTPRKEYVAQSIRKAMIPLDNPKYYRINKT